MLSVEDTDYLVNEMNQTQAEYPRKKMVHELFEDQVKVNPNEIAVIFAEWFGVMFGVNSAHKCYRRSVNIDTAIIRQRNH